MYVIFNSNGSIKEERIAGYTQQGENNATTIQVAIDGVSPSTYGLEVHCVLPNKEVVDFTSTETTDVVDSKQEHYEGIVFSLPSTVTALAGIIRVNIVCLDDETSKVLVSYPIYISINEGVSNKEAVIVSEEEYQSLIRTLNDKSTVSGTHYEGNWQSLTINGVTKFIIGGEGQLHYTGEQGVDVEIDKIKLDLTYINNLINTAINTVKTETLNQLHPVGSVYMSFEENAETVGVAGKDGCPLADTFGTWERLVGRFLLPSASGEANTTGGSATHIHDLSGAFARLVFRNEGNIDIEYMDGTATWVANSRISGGTLSTSSQSSNEGVRLGGNTSNVSSYPPYRTVYAWKRIADPE